MTTLRSGSGSSSGSDIDDAGERRRAVELVGHRVDAVLRMRQLGESPPLSALVGLVDAHLLLEVVPEALVGLAVAIERPHQLRVAQRQPIAGLAVVAAGVPGVPRLAVAVH